MKLIAMLAHAGPSCNLEIDEECVGEQGEPESGSVLSFLVCGNVTNGTFTGTGEQMAGIIVNPNVFLTVEGMEIL
jgi:hypothetical protein